MMHRCEDDATRAATMVVIPAFQEAGAIGEVVHTLREQGWRTVVIDDGSADATSRAAALAGAAVVRHAVNLGQGAALRTGFAYALADPTVGFVVTFEADGQHGAGAVADLVAPLVSGNAQVTLGSRFLRPTSTSAMPPRRRLLLRLATRIARLTTGLPLTDTHNGLRAFEASALRRVTLTQDRMAHASEILAEIAGQGLRVEEVAVEVAYTEYSLAKGQRMIDAVSILWDLLLARTR